MKKNLTYILTSLLIFFRISDSYSCTTFCIKTDDQLVFGRNYDFMIGYGLVIINKKDVTKTSFNVKDNTLKWISKYGSVTFNQFGREFPTGGINEAGLVVELMWLDDTKYSAADDRPATGGVLQWIQYQLDNCETVQEVIDTDKDIRIPSTSVPLHFLITDKYGTTASIEYLDGMLVSFTSDNMKHRVLTNNTYESSLKYLDSFVDSESERHSNNSLYRFAKACRMTQSYNKEKDGNAVDYGFKILKDVSQGEATKWSIVYDIKDMKIHFKTYDNDKLKVIDMASIDFSCSSPVTVLDVNADASGNVNELFTSYTYEANRKLIGDSYGGVEFLQGIPAEAKDATAKYPEQLFCRSKSDNMNEFENNNTEGSDERSPGLFYMACGAVIASAVLSVYFRKAKRT